jgi:glycosylphosphatidylinositol phospholipase D
MRNETLFIYSKFFILFILIFCPMAASPCGMATHGEVSQRAMWSFDAQDSDYNQYIATHQDALQAGSVFPDWGYSFGYGNESEEAHWDPFIKHAADYIHRNYPKPWDEETEKLAVFLLGIMSHSTADNSWHALSGMSEGFINAMGYQDFNGSYGDAHSLADFGGDVMCSYEFDLSWISPVWYVPVQDMANVYNEMGYDSVTPDVLIEYSAVLFMAIQAERLAWYLYPQSAIASPFLAEQFQDYFIGGLDEMAIWSSWRWHDVIDWMENGESLSLQKTSYGILSESKNPFIDQLLLNLDDIIIEETERGAIFRINPAAYSSSGKTISSPGPSQTWPLTTKRSITYTSSIPYTYLGTSLASGDFNNDKVDDLVIGAPGYGSTGHPQKGAVYICYGKKKLKGNSETDLTSDRADIALTGASDFGRFGWSLAVVDFNADGFDDLAVSSPTLGEFASQVASEYKGKIFVFLGGKTKHWDAESPDFIISANDDYTNLGWCLSSGDCNEDGFDDLIIGAPFARAGGIQRGLVAIFLSSPRKDSGNNLSLTDATWIAKGQNNYDWFGYHVDIAEMPGKKTFLLIGAPTADNDNTLSVGRIYGFDLSGVGKTSSSPVPFFTITGTDNFEKLATNFACGDPYGDGQPLLAIASPTKEVTSPAEQSAFSQFNPADIIPTIPFPVIGNVNPYYQIKSSREGATVFIPLKDLKGSVGLADLNPKATFLGKDSFAHFGWDLGFSDYNNDGIDDFWASEPWSITSSGAETGSVFMWQGGDAFPSGTVESSTSNATLNLSHTLRQSRFGSKITFGDFNGDGCPDIAIAAPNVSDKARLAGSVYLLVSPQASTDDIDGDGMSNEWEIENSLNPADTTDADGDIDDDGIINRQEYDNGLNPNVDDANADADNDKMPNKWEIDNSLDPRNPNDASEDNDRDGYTNYQEFMDGTDPENATSNPDAKAKYSEMCFISSATVGQPTLFEIIVLAFLGFALHCIVRLKAKNNKKQAFKKIYNI